MKTIFTYAVCVLLLSSFTFVSIDEVINAMRTGNASQLSKYFDNTVEIALPDKSNSYSKSQAELVLKDFFSTSIVKDFEVLHKGDNSGSQYSIDTNNVVQEIERLRSKYPVFINDFTHKILGFDPGTPPDSLKKYIAAFIKDYRFVKDSADKLFADFDPSAKEIKRGLQFVKYYFPAYKFPAKIITFIGPFDGYSDVLTSDAFAVGLQLHMGRNFSFYKSDISQDLFPNYIIQKFEPQYIPVNCMKNIVDDMYPDKSIGKPLVEQMVEKGKRLYLLDKFLPYTPEHLKIGYTEQQMKDAYANEAIIWDLFVNNDLLNNTEQNITKNYVGEGPKTQELGEGSPGNIGSFAGWQIVKKFMSKNPKINLEQLMSMDAREVYSQSKYKPKT